MRNDQRPPKWPLKFLRQICPDYLFEEIEGDMLERFCCDVKTSGLRKARWRFVWTALSFFRPGILLRNRLSISILSFYMLISYWKVAARVMVRNRFFSAINIAGLACGITGALLLFLWVNGEFRFDDFHADKERIYKAWSRNTFDGALQCWDRTPRVLAPTLKEEYAAMEDAITFTHNDVDFLFRAGEIKLVNQRGAYTDPGFLEMFSFPLLKGTAVSAMERPDGIVLTEHFAAELFGQKEAFGEVISISAEGYTFDFTVTGILKNLPSATDFEFDYLIPYSFLENLEGKQTDWSNNHAHTWVKVRQSADLELLNTQIRTIVKRNTGNETDTEIFLYPLSRMHLYSRFENGKPAGGRIEIMRMMLILAGCLILVACINFINLSTARAQKRAREVGVRKVTGAYRSSLIVQFLFESLLLAFISGTLAIGLVYILLPHFSHLVNQDIRLSVFDIRFWLCGVAALITLGLLAGAYPAFVLSAFKPVSILKGSPHSKTGRNFFRKALVVAQFGLAITLVFSTVVIRKQIMHVQNRDAGYDRNNLMYHFITGDLSKHFTAYRDEIVGRGFAESVTKTSAPITEGWSSSWDIKWNGRDPQTKTVVERFYADEHFTKTTGVKILTGRDMDLQKYPSDSSAVLLNETAAKLMDFENPIGELIIDGASEWHVIGVVSDFIVSSPYHKVNPLIIMGGKGWFNVVHIRLNVNKPVRESIAGIRSVFSKYNPVYPFDYHFADDSYRSKFASLAKTLTITTVFAAAVIFIACLGLLGLSTYMIESRTKEIGVRKVFGGSVAEITRLLCMSSLKPIFISMLIFTPVSWFAMNWWLQFSEYRTSIDISVLAIAWFSILGVALLTIGAQTVRAAMTKPVTSLKVE